MAATYARSERMDDAEWQITEMDMLGFEGTIDTIINTQPIQDPEYISRYRNALKRAGIPE